MRYFQNKFEDFTVGSDVYIDTDKWKARVEEIVKSVLNGMPPDHRNCDGGLYVGNAGAAYMFYYLANSEMFSSRKADFLENGLIYGKAATDYVERGGHRGDPPCSFILGGAGAVAVYSLLFDTAGNKSKSQKLAEHFVKLADHAKKMNFYPHGSDEVLVGRAGYLSGALTLQQKLGYKVVMMESNRT